MTCNGCRNAHVHCIPHSWLQCLLEYEPCCRLRKECLYFFVSFLYFLFLFFLLSRVLTVAKRRTVVTFGLASGLRVSKVSTVTNRKGPACETQNCRHFWTRVGSSRLKSVNSHTSEGSWSRNAELSSLLDSRQVFASQKCQQTQIGRVLVSKRRTVLTAGLVLRLRVSNVNSHRDRGFLFAKRRT